MLRSLALLPALVLAACAPRDALTPETFSAYVAPGDTEHFRVRVDLATMPPSTEPTDILFLFDITQSMARLIGQVRDNAGRIMLELRAANPNSHFGVASFADYQVHLPWQLNQDITEDPAAVQSAIAALRLYDGVDRPEAYSRALYEARFIGWRPGARRFVILFGDAPPHDPEFAGEKSALDPGRDGISGTEDDLRYRDVVAQLAHDHIVVISNYDPSYAPARRAFEYVSAQTGGAAIPVKEAKEVPAAILAGLSEASFVRPRLEVPADYASWVTVSAAARERKSDLKAFFFDVSVAVPSGTRNGVFRFPLSARYVDSTRSVEIGATQVRIMTGWRFHPAWRWLMLLLALLALLLFSRRHGRQGSRRYLHGHFAAQVAVKLVKLTLFACVVYLAWRWLEGADKVLPAWVWS